MRNHWPVISFLSMGAVFSIFGAYYYWSEKMIGFTYNELLGQIQFWSLFIGVNLLFGPMHFLGLNGCPRRISDYPDAFAEWNYIASIGSIISLFSVFLFIFILYLQFTQKLTTLHHTDYNTYHSYLFAKNLKFNYGKRDLEFQLSSPPSSHSFSELPVL